MMLLRLLVIALLASTTYQLSKSDRKVVDVDDDEAEQDAGLDEAADSTFDLSSLEYEPSTITKESILKEHSQIDQGSERKFNGASMAYITPWNNKGYDLAKSTSQRLTHVAPVWLQLKPQTADRAFSCRIEGTHDIDHGWMDEVRQPNPSVKFVPRVLFEGWSTEELWTMIKHEQWSSRCMTDLINFLTRNQFDGAVVEVWMDIMSRTRGEAGPMLVEFLNSWGDAFHRKNLEIIIPVGPAVDQNNQLTSMFLPSHLHQLGPHVDYVQIMTYDYPATAPHGVAPLDWVQGSLDALLEGSSLLADKIMIGLNFYGYRHSSRGTEAIKYDQYLDLLKKKSSELEWDAISMEHFVTVDNSKSYYPSLTSLELRIRLAEKYGVGIAVWDYGQGLNYFTRLL